MEPDEFVFPGQGQIGYIAAGARLATRKLTKIIGDNVMEARLLLVRRGRGVLVQIDAVEELNQLENANLEPGFFP